MHMQVSLQEDALEYLSRSNKVEVVHPLIKSTGECAGGTLGGSGPSWVGDRRLCPGEPWSIWGRQGGTAGEPLSLDGIHNGTSLTRPQQSLSKENLAVNFPNSVAIQPWPRPWSVAAAELTTDSSLAES